MAHRVEPGCHSARNAVESWNPEAMDPASTLRFAQDDDTEQVFT